MHHATMNRKERRAHAKQQRRQPPAPRRVAAVNTLEIAKAGAGGITAAERAHIMAPANAAFTALREGVASFDQWEQIDTCVLIALQIEDLGVVRGLRAHFVAAATALAEIRRRVEADPAGPAWGRRTTLYFAEIEAIREAIHLTDFQLQHLSLRELRQATSLAENKIRGRRGAERIDTATLINPKQERLL